MSDHFNLLKANRNSEYSTEEVQATRSNKINVFRSKLNNCLAIFLKIKVPLWVVLLLGICSISLLPILSTKKPSMKNSHWVVLDSKLQFKDSKTTTGKSYIDSSSITGNESRASFWMKVESFGTPNKAWNKVKGQYIYATEAFLVINCREHLVADPLRVTQYNKEGFIISDDNLVDDANLATPKHPMVSSGPAQDAYVYVCNHLP